VHCALHMPGHVRSCTPFKEPVRLQLHWKNFANKITSLSCMDNDTVLSQLMTLWEHDFVKFDAPEEIRVISNGRQLDIFKTFNENNVESDQTLWLMKRIVGGMGGRRKMRKSAGAAQSPPSVGAGTLPVATEGEASSEGEPDDDDQVNIANMMMNVVNSLQAQNPNMRVQFLGAHDRGTHTDFTPQRLQELLGTMNLNQSVGASASAPAATPPAAGSFQGAPFSGQGHRLD